MSRRYDDATRERARALRREGKLHREIAAGLDLPIRVVTYLTRGIHAPGPAPGRRVAGAWRPKWDALLGTDTDRNLAAQLDVSASLVCSHRRALDIPAYRLARGVAYAAALAVVSDDDLARESADAISARVGVPARAVRAARLLRGVRFQRPVDDAVALRHAAVAGMLAACEVLDGATHNGAQSRIAEVLGVTRERARQLCDEVRAMLRAAAGAS